MECHRGILFDAECLAHFDCKVTHEMGISIMDEHFGKAHVFEHMFQIEFGNSFCCYRFIAWDKDYCFSAVIVTDAHILSLFFCILYGFI